MSTHVRNIDALSTQTRRYPPADGFAATANATAAIYDAGLEEFWAAEARQRLDWITPFETVLEWERPYAKWFLGGKLNAADNCVDRWVTSTVQPMSATRSATAFPL